MFRFRSSPSPSPSSSLPTVQSNQPRLSASNSATSTLSTADSLAPSSTSTSSILSLLQAHSSSSTSTCSALSASLSSATSLSSLPSDSCLAPENSATSTTTQLSEPTKPNSSPIPRTPSTPARKQLPHAETTSRRASLVTSPRTSKAAITTTTQSSPSLARRRNIKLHTSTEHRSSNVGVMAKKAKVGSATKSTPFTKSASSSASTKEDSTDMEKIKASEINADANLPAVIEDEMTSTSVSSVSTSTSKSVEVASSSSESKQNVVVCVRMRPSGTSSSTAEPAVWCCDSTKNQIVPTEHHPAIAKRTTSSERAGAGASIAAASSNDLDHEDPSTSTYRFQFDKLITAQQTTDDMYHSHIAPVVRAAMEGYNGTVFAYGQTGSGKTHTMSGSDKEPGVIPRAVQQVFQMIKDEPDREFLLRVSYLEIYNETLKDLLAPLTPLSGSTGASLQTTDRPASPIKGCPNTTGGVSQASTLRIIEDQKQSRVIITGLREEIVTDPDTVLDLIQRGQDERHVGATDWNERSSRSHCVFQLTVESRARSTASSMGKEVRISQLNLIDLAGSERAASQAERRKEGAFINKSLLTLGTVIGKLTEPSETGDAHIPYRDSKLTRILQTSLSGNARIAVICTLSPDTEHANETLSTLKFGKRCKLVVTTAKKGTALDDKALLQKYRKELDALRARLEANGPSPNPDNVVGAMMTTPDISLESQQKLDELNQQREAAKKEVDDMQKRRSDLKGQIEHLTRLIVTSQSIAANASDGNVVAGPSTPVRGRGVHASALARRGPRMSDLHFATGAGAGPLYNSPVVGSGPFSTDETNTPGAATTLSGVKPFELEAELAALRRQLRQQIESHQALIIAHQKELAARDARQTELEQAIRLNEEELDEAEVAYDKLKNERDEARKIALKEQEKARENRKKLLEEQEANRLLKLVAKARADDQDNALQNQIDTLRQQLAVKEAEASAANDRFQQELEQARKALDEAKAARAQAEGEMQEAQQAKQTMQVELEAAIATSAELKEKQAASERSAPEEDDDVNAEFQDLVRGKGVDADRNAEIHLKQREAELTKREAQLERLHAELEQTRRELSTQRSLESSTREIATLGDELSQSQEERRSLEIELAKLRASTSGHDQNAQKIAELSEELASAKSKIAELEKQVAEEKAKTAEALKSVSRPLPVPSSVYEGASGGYRSVPNSPVKVVAGASKLRPGVSSGTSTALGSGSGLNRAGSVKEYRRYQGADAASPASPASPSPDVGSRSVLMRHDAVFGGARSSTMLACSGMRNRAEKEEIERLNAVINSQRALMADLEKSVASWKTRMKAQTELIHKLVMQNNTTASGGQSPPTSDGENDCELGLQSYRSPHRNLPDNNVGEHRDHLHHLPRTTHLSLAPRQPSHANNEPYYGAHTYNRPPPSVVSMLSPHSPTKPFSNYSHTWSANSPSPLPLPDGTNPSPSRRKPRKTIELDLKLLNASPRVESNKSKFSHDSSLTNHDTPTKRSHTNASAYYI